MKVRRIPRAIRRKWRRYKIERAYSTITNIESGKTVGFTPTMMTWGRMQEDGWIELADGEIRWQRSVFPEENT